MTDTDQTVRALLAADDASLPLPGRGNTAERHMRLYEIARRHPLSVARLVEAHTDAVAISCEAGHEPVRGALYGVWASSGPGGEVALAGGPGIGSLTGTKAFCSGVGLADRALVTAVDGDGRLVMVDIDARSGDTVRFDTSTWRTEALEDASTGAALFDRHPVERPVLGDADRWYLDRPGFWYGACGPAACWAGGAAALVDAAEDLIDADPHRRADLGAMRAARWAMEASLSAAGDQIDRAEGADGRHLALSLRHTIERLATEVLDRFGQALGPRPFVGDVELARRWSDTHLYLRQHHGARDLATLGQSA